MKYIQNILKNTAVTLVVVSMFFGYFSFATPRAHAFDLDDFFNTTTSVFEGVETPTNYWQLIKENALDTIAYTLAQQLSQKMVSSLLNWANSGFEGNPFFVSDPSQFGQEIAFGQASRVADVLRNDLQTGFNYQALVALGKGFANDQRQQFTLDGLIGDDWDEYATGGDFTKGGYVAWYEQVRNDYNNAIGTQTAALNQAQNLADIYLDATMEELRRNAGFQDEKECLNEIELFDGTTQCTRYNVRTPGDIVRSGVALSFEQPFNKLASSDEFGEILAASLSQLVNGLVDIGLSKLKGGITNAFASNPSQDSFNRIIDVSDLESPQGNFDQGQYSPTAEAYNFDFENIVEFDVEDVLYGSPESIRIRGLAVRVNPETSTIAFASSGTTIGSYEEETRSSFSYINQQVTPAPITGTTLIRITEDIDDSYFEHEYYYTDADGNLYDAIIDVESPAAQKPLIVRNGLGALQAFDDAIASTQAQQDLIISMGELINRIDRECVLGPDIGFESRFNDNNQSNDGDADERRRRDYIAQFALHSLKEGMRDPIFDDDDMQTIFPQGGEFVSMIQEGKTIVAQSTKHHRKYFTNDENLNEWKGQQIQVQSIESKYNDPALTIDEQQRQIETLYGLVEEQQIPTLRERERESQYLQQLQEEITQYQEYYDGDCQTQLARPEFAFPIFLDKLELLYCPLEHESARLGREGRDTGFVRSIQQANDIINEPERTRVGVSGSGGILTGGISRQYAGGGGLLPPRSLGINWDLYYPFISFPRILEQFFENVSVETDPDTGLQVVDISRMINSRDGRSADATNRDTSRIITLETDSGLQVQYDFDYFKFQFRGGEEEFLEVSCGDFYRAPIESYLPFSQTGL